MNQQDNEVLTPQGTHHDGQSGGQSRWRTSRRRLLGLTGAGIAAAAVGTGAAGCGTAKTGRDEGAGSAKGRAGAAGDTLFVSGMQWGPPSGFNPVAAATTFPAGMGQIQLLFESLLRFNLLDGSLQPGLGTELVENDGGKSFTVALQEGTAWADGKPLTAEDVVFTFEMGKNAALPYSNVWEYLESVTATDDRTIEFKVKEKPFNPLTVKGSIAGTTILPKHIWEPFAKAKTLAKQKNDEPIGSGPFKVEKADQTQVVLTRRDDYWGKEVFGTPAMKSVVHPIFKTGNDGDIKLQSGEIDVSQQFTPQIWKMWEDGKPVATWLKDKPYFIPGNIPLLQINQTVKGLDNPLVRRAIAHAIDYPNVATTAMSDYSDPANASLVLPTGSEAPFYDEAAVKEKGWTFDKAKAIKIIEEDLKATKGSDGIYKLPDGTRLGPWTLITPTGWTDWNTACEIVAKSCQAVGIDVKTEFPQAPNVTSKMQNGDFQLACWSASGVSPASPWSRFRDLLDDRGAAPVGKTTFFNFIRFKHPDVPGLLDDAGAATTDEERKVAYGKLDAIYRETIPVIPLMYRPLEFYEFNESNWTGFPTEEDPYAPPMWQGAGVQWLFKIKKIGS